MMGEFKGTKGKWEINPRASRNVRCNNISIANCSASQNGESEIEEKYNALLISKAPEMLEMLEKLAHGEHFVGVLEIRDLIKQATEFKL